MGCAVCILVHARFSSGLIDHTLHICCAIHTDLQPGCTVHSSSKHALVESSDVASSLCSSNVLFGSSCQKKHQRRNRFCSSCSSVGQYYHGVVDLHCASRLTWNRRGWWNCSAVATVKNPSHSSLSRAACIFCNTGNGAKSDKLAFPRHLCARCPCSYRSSFLASFRPSGSAQCVGAVSTLGCSSCVCYG